MEISLGLHGYNSTLPLPKLAHSIRLAIFPLWVCLLKAPTGTAMLCPGDWGNLLPHVTNGRLQGGCWMHFLFTEQGTSPPLFDGQHTFPLKIRPTPMPIEHKEEQEAVSWIFVCMIPLGLQISSYCGLICRSFDRYLNLQVKNSPNICEALCLTC